MGEINHSPSYYKPTYPLFNVSAKICMRIRLLFLFLFFHLNLIRAQSYGQDWSKLYSKMESGTAISVSEAESFYPVIKTNFPLFPITPRNCIAFLETIIITRIS